MLANCTPIKTEKGDSKPTKKQKGAEVLCRKLKYSLRSILCDTLSISCFKRLKKNNHFFMIRQSFCRPQDAKVFWAMLKYLACVKTQKPFFPTPYTEEVIKIDHWLIGNKSNN